MHERTHSKQQRAFFVIGLSIILFLTSRIVGKAAEAATYYVATTGSDTNAGSSSSPWATINKCASVVNPGDTCLVADGTYTGNNGGAVVYAKRGGTAANPVTFRSANKYGAVICLPSVSSGNSFGFYIAYDSTAGTYADYVTIQDFSFRCGNNTGTTGAVTAIDSQAGRVGLVIRGNDITLSHICTDSGYGLSGIYLEVSNTTVTGNTIRDIRRLYPGENGCNPTSTRYQNSGMGIYCRGCSDTIITNNLFRDFGGWPVQFYGANSGGQTAANVSVYNNTFANHNPYQLGHIVFGTAANTINIKNNISHDATSAFIQYTSGLSATAVAVDHNLITATSIDVATNRPASGIIFSNNVLGASLTTVMNDPTTYDYSLKAGSAAIDVGVSLTAVQTDYVGLTRPQGSAYDIGAYEFPSTATAVPAAPTNFQVGSQ